MSQAQTQAQVAIQALKNGQKSAQQILTPLLGGSVLYGIVSGTDVQKANTLPAFKSLIQTLITNRDKILSDDAKDILDAMQTILSDDNTNVALRASFPNLRSFTYAAADALATIDSADATEFKKAAVRSASRKRPRVTDSSFQTVLDNTQGIGETQLTNLKGITGPVADYLNQMSKKIVYESKDGTTKESYRFKKLDKDAAKALTGVDRAAYRKARSILRAIRGYKQLKSFRQSSTSEAYIAKRVALSNAASIGNPSLLYRKLLNYGSKYRTLEKGKITEASKLAIQNGLVASQKKLNEKVDLSMQNLFGVRPENVAAYNTLRDDYNKLYGASTLKTPEQINALFAALK